MAELTQEQLRKEIQKIERQEKAIRLFSSLNKSYDWLILDIEATGFSSSKTSEIIEIAIIDANKTVWFHSLIKPIHPIPEESTQFHRITNAMVKNAPTWEQVYKKIYKILLRKKRRILAYSASSEKQFLRQTSRMWKIKPPYIPMICLSRAYQHLLKGNQVSLETAVGHQVKHRALPDCFATWELIRKLQFHPAILSREPAKSLPYFLLYMAECGIDS